MSTTSIDITSANSVLVLTAATVFPNGITLQGFSTDQSYSPDAQDFAEVRMGVDGYLAAGYTPTIKKVTINLEANSPSYDSLANLASAQNTNLTTYVCTLTARVPSIGKSFKWSNGVLQSANWIPPAKKVLEPTSWVFNFAAVDIADI